MQKIVTLKKDSIRPQNMIQILLKKGKNLMILYLSNWIGYSVIITAKSDILMEVTMSLINFLSDI